MKRYLLLSLIVIFGLNYSAKADNGELEIVELIPANGAEDVPVDGELKIVFNEDIEFEGGQFIFDNLGSFATGWDSPFSIEGNTLIFEAGEFDYNTTISLTKVDGNPVKGVSGATFDWDELVGNWSFITEEEPIDGIEWVVYPELNPAAERDNIVLSGEVSSGNIVYYMVSESFEEQEPFTNPSSDKIFDGNDNFSGNLFETEIDITDLLLGDRYYLYLQVEDEDEGIESDFVRITIDRRTRSLEESYPADGFLALKSEDELFFSFSRSLEYGIAAAEEDELIELSNENVNNFFILKNGDGDIVEDYTVSFDEDFKCFSIVSDNQEGWIEHSYTLQIKLSNAFWITYEEEIYFETDIPFIWTGNVDSNWFVSENWEGESEFIPGKSVTIPKVASENYPILENDVKVHDLIVEPEASLTQNGGELTVTGLFNLKSNPEKANASYLPFGGELIVDPDKVKVEQSLYVDERGPYILASPVSGVTRAGMGLGFFIKKFDNPQGAWINWEDPLELGVGYTVHSDIDLVYSGEINRKTVEKEVVRTDGKGWGWNFIGNPFTAAIDWDLIEFDKDKIENEFWSWDIKQDVHNPYNGNAGVGGSIIPSNSGVQIRVKNGIEGGVFTIKPQAMVLNESSTLKSSSRREKPEHITISTLTSQHYKDNSVIAFIQEALPQVDKYDSEKRFGGGNNPLEIFSIADDTKLSINSLPFDNEVEVPFGYRANKAGEYGLMINSDYLKDKEVVLIDYKKDKEIVMEESVIYDFSVTKTGSNTQRFALLFTKDLSTSLVETKSTANHINADVYSKKGSIVIDLKDKGSSNQYKYTLFDMGGRSVAQGYTKSTVTNIEKEPGSYIVALWCKTTSSKESYKVVLY
ncbi:Ig-like domain-containing protein [Marinilabiliaceae bacterium ANBcel2]|nr:Ig-like domain-containing protein [Marinilabiliaceae bacterium ANBcel2]